MSPISREVSFTASYPIFVWVVPYTTDVLAPPYTFFPTVAPTIFTVLLELLLLSVPVAAWFPPPNTLFVTLLFPSIIKLVFPYTIADTPFPPAYKLLFKVEFLTLTYVFPVTVPSFPPPYTLSATFPPERVTFVFVLTPAWFPPPNTLFWTSPFILTFVTLLIAWFPPPYTSWTPPPFIVTFVVWVIPPWLFPPYTVPIIDFV